MSILAKYSLWLMGILLLAAGCITGAALVYQRDSLTHEAMLRGESIALNLAAPAANAFLSHDALLMVELATGASRDNQGVEYAALLDAHGMKAADFGRLLELEPSMGSKLINGTRQLTAAHIRALAAHFALPAEYFL